MGKYLNPILTKELNDKEQLETIAMQSRLLELERQREINVKR